jgi:hypothetical protein
VCYTTGAMHILAAEQYLFSDELDKWKREAESSFLVALNNSPKTLPQNLNHHAHVRPITAPMLSLIIPAFQWSIWDRYFMYESTQVNVWAAESGFGRLTCPS